MVNREFVHSNFVRIRDAALNIGTSQVQNHLSLSISPNPSHDFITVNTNDGRSIEDWKIYNSSGKIVLEGQADLQLMRIDISSLESGSYILESIHGHRQYNARFIR